MKTAIVWIALCLAAATSTLAAERKAIVLKNGTVLEGGRIVAVGSDTATIVHRGGSITVEADQVDLELLARAKIDLEEGQAARKVRVDSATKTAEKQKAVDDLEKKQRIDLALAESAARSGELKQATKAQVQQIDKGQRVIALKSAFPAKAMGNARVFIPRSGKNNKPYMVSSTVADLPDGGRYASTTTRHNAGPGRIDTIEYAAPPDDVYNWYRGTFQTTTLQALPRTLQLVSERLASDTAKFQTASSSLQSSTAAQAQHTLYWFDRSLKPYMDSWRALLR
jgi:hypothetical protein